MKSNFKQLCIFLILLLSSCMIDDNDKNEFREEIQYSNFNITLSNINNNYYGFRYFRRHYRGFGRPDDKYVDLSVEDTPTGLDVACARQLSIDSFPINVGNLPSQIPIKWVMKSKLYPVDDVLIAQIDVYTYNRLSYWNSYLVDDFGNITTKKNLTTNNHLINYNDIVLYRNMSCLSEISDFDPSTESISLESF